MCTRAARFCHAASHGGQVTAPFDLMQRVIRAWTGVVRLPSNAEMQGRPLHVQVPENAEASLLPWQISILASGRRTTGSRNIQSLVRLRNQPKGDASGGCNCASTLGGIVVLGGFSSIHDTVSGLRRQQLCICCNAVPKILAQRLQQNWVGFWGLSRQLANPRAVCKAI